MVTLRDEDVERIRSAGRFRISSAERPGFHRDLELIAAGFAAGPSAEPESAFVGLMGPRAADPAAAGHRGIVDS